MLLTWVFCAGMASTLSSLVYFPFVSHFHSRYTSAMQLGMAFSGVIPSILGLIQSPSSETPRFSLIVFFSCIAVVMVACFIAFLSLVFAVIPRIEADTSIFQCTSISAMPPADPTLEPLLFSPVNGSNTTLNHSAYAEYLMLWKELFNVCLCNCLENGVLTQVFSCRLGFLHFQIITYACSPYSSKTLECGSIFCMLAAPLGSLLPLFIKFRPHPLVMTCTYMVPFVYILAIALESPSPPL